MKNAVDNIHERNYDFIVRYNYNTFINVQSDLRQILENGDKERATITLSDYSSWGIPR